MDELLKNQILIDELARAIAEERDEDALKYYEQYKKNYEKITGEKFPNTFEELKNMKNKNKNEEEIEDER